jgi:RES domain-containing protein
MSDFKSIDAYWDFARTVRSDRRFIFDGKAGGFLEAARAASKSRARSLKLGFGLYRAQLGSDFWTRPTEDGDKTSDVEEVVPLPEARMVPDPKFITQGGRANPPGFAYLYLATNEKTALAEMRPWVEESLTLALFQILQNIKLVVCQPGAEDLGERLFEENPSAEKLDKYVWNDISKAFARPVSREEKENAYLPTQILGEAFKAEGFDGLAYRSSLERGMNVVLFNPHVAKLVRLHVYTLKKVRYDFEGAPNYSIYRVKEGKGEVISEIRTESP